MMRIKIGAWKLSKGQDSKNDGCLIPEAREVTREVALGRRPTCVCLCLLWPFGSNAPGGKGEGSVTVSGVCSQHSTAVFTGPEAWGA